MRRISAMLVAVALGGCAAANTALIDAPPIDYRQLARDHVRDHFPNSQAIRSAQISAPKSTAGWALAETDQPNYWAVCLRTKDNAGKRAIAKDTVLLIRGNQVMDARDDVASTNVCNGAQLEPFPELLRGA
jgi:hypothetical protein